MMSSKLEEARARIAAIADPVAEVTKRFPDYSVGEEVRVEGAGGGVFLTARWTENGQPKTYRWQVPVLEVEEGVPHVLDASRVIIARSVLVDAELRSGRRT